MKKKTNTDENIDTYIELSDDDGDCALTLISSYFYFDKCFDTRKDAIDFIKLLRTIPVYESKQTKIKINI